MNSPDPRLQQLAAWLGAQPGWSGAQLSPASADASFRRYFRAVRADLRSAVIMDAPPDKEDIAPYIKVSGLLERCGVHVPAIAALDVSQGFILLEDLGSTPMLAALRAAGADASRLYAAALQELLQLQTRGIASARELAPYDAAALQREMDLLPEWYCGRHLQIELSSAEQRLLERTGQQLIESALEQPVVFVHRDYHSRNLMVVPTRSPGVIDFQDALAGPLTYDLVSLLKDCYIDWPRALIEEWVCGYRRQLMAAGVATAGDERQFLRWFDFMGLQRHMKVLGIFARLCYRDGKSGYLGDLPRTLEYVRDAAARYPDLNEFADFVARRLTPGLAAANARAADVALARNSTAV